MIYVTGLYGIEFQFFLLQYFFLTIAFIFMQNVNTILYSFQKLGYNKKSLIKYNTFLEILNELLTYKFDVQVADQLWQQANINENRAAEVQQLCIIIYKAQEILREKLTQTVQKISLLEKQKKHIEEDLSIRPAQKLQQIKNIVGQIQELKKDQIEFRQDLKLVSQPFKAQASNLKETKFFSKIASRVNQNPVQQQHIQNNNSNVLNGTPNDQFKWIFWISIIILLIQIVFAFVKFNNLNLIVCLTILLIFLLMYFDTFYMKICFTLTIVSTILDILWCVLYLTSFWSPPITGSYSQNQTGFLRFVVIFTFITIFLKIPLMILIFRNRIVTAQTNYNIVFFGKYTLNLTGNNRSLVTQFINRTADQ